jgi:transcription termination factor NusB
LVTATIDGLLNTAVKWLLRRANPVDRECLRTTLFNIVSKEVEAFLKGYGDATSFDRLQSVTQRFIRGDL